jgi:DNA-binding LytR/AlgR family response regulator
MKANTFVEQLSVLICKTGISMNEYDVKLSQGKTRLVAKRGEDNVALKLEDVAFIYRDHALVIAVDKEQKKYICSKTLMQLEEELKQLFFRVNRKYLININFIKSYKVFEKVKLEVSLTISTQHQIIVSQENARLFKKWISEEL